MISLLFKKNGYGNLIIPQFVHISFPLVIGQLPPSRQDILRAWHTVNAARAPRVSGRFGAPGRHELSG